ncbi:MAG: sigma-70 family RNA polymerase sigma factor [bacterium]|nr:MAG: sigma-70 family RNA polymerase sigma factor [bacterium]
MSEETLEFQKIYTEFAPKLHRYFTRLTGERDAEDLTQETMVKVSQGLERFRGEASLSTWIYSIATNVARDRLRSAAHKADAVTVTAGERDLSVTPWVAAPPPASLERITVRKEMNT